MKKIWISVRNQYRFYQLHTLNQTSQNDLNGFRIPTFFLNKIKEKRHFLNNTETIVFLHIFFVILCQTEKAVTSVSKLNRIIIMVVTGAKLI